MSIQRTNHHRTSNGHRREVSDIPETISVVSNAESRTIISAAPPSLFMHTSAAAAGLVLLFCISSIAQFSTILNSPNDQENSIPLRRSLQGDNTQTEYIIPIADASTNEDVGILWQETPFSSTTHNYFECMGKKLTSKIEAVNGVTPTSVSITNDWSDAMSKLALTPEDISALVKSGKVDDLLVLTYQPMAAVKTLLSEKQRGRIMGLFRHPAESVAIHFSKLSHSENNPKYREHYIKNMDSDLMVKKILGVKPTDAVSIADLRVAMDFVRNNVVVGLVSEQEESLRRFTKALGMDERLNVNCTVELEHVSLNEEQVIAQNSLEWIAIAQRSPLDMMLYTLIEKLFEEQSEIFYEYSDLEATQDQVLWSDNFNASHLVSFDAPFTKSDMHTPFFWHVPRSGGSHLQDLYWCMDFTLANQVGGEPRFNKAVPRHLLVEFQPWKEHGNKAKVLNVDMSTRNGIVHAKNLGLLTQKNVPKPDIIFSTQFHSLSTILFSSHHKARVFALFRHPVDRAVSRFRSLQKTNKAWENLPVETWAIQDNHEANWMVRQLVGKGPDDVVDIKDLEFAKRILHDKFVVGLSDNYQESVRRFNMLLGFDESDARTISCMQSHPTKSEGAPRIVEGSPAYVTLMSINFLDAMLYKYAEECFQSQAELFKQ